MREHKKIRTIIIVLAVLILGLSACGTQPAVDNTAETKPVTDNTATDTAADNTAGTSTTADNTEAVSIATDNTEAASTVADNPAGTNTAADNVADINTYTLDSSHEVDGRQGIAWENGLYYVSGSTSLSVYDANWNRIKTETEPFGEFDAEVNHIGDIDVYNKEIYAGVEYFMDGAASNIQMAVYDAETLKLTRTYMFDPNSGQTEVSGITVDPDHGWMWMCSWAEDDSGSFLYRYDLETGEYQGKVHMEKSPQLIQGIAYYDDWIYITADDGSADDDEPDHVYKCKVDPALDEFPVITEKTLDDVTRQGEIEGLSFDKEKKQLLVSYNRGAIIVKGMPKGFYDDYDAEIHEVFVYNSAISSGSNETADTGDTGTVSEEKTESAKEVKSEEPALEPSMTAETFPETVFFDQSDIKITGEGFSLNEDNERVINLTIVNNSSSEIKVRGHNAIIDGYVVGLTGGDVAVAAGETIPAEFYFMESDLELTGITSIHDISTSWYITGDGLDDSSNPTDMISVETDAVSVIEEQDTGQFNELYNTDGIVILSDPQLHEDQFHDNWMYIFGENDTEDTLVIDTIRHLAAGGTRSGMRYLYPHSKYWDKFTVHDKDTYYVRVSVVTDAHNWDKIAETEETAIELS